MLDLFSVYNSIYCALSCVQQSYAEWRNEWIQKYICIKVFQYALELYSSNVVMSLSRNTHTHTPHVFGGPAMSKRCTYTFVSFVCNHILMRSHSFHSFILFCFGWAFVYSFSKQQYEPIHVSAYGHIADVWVRTRTHTHTYIWHFSNSSELNSSVFNLNSIQKLVLIVMQTH